MAKITLKEALKQASVVDELKNFVGLTKDDAVGLMTPERLAAVAGGFQQVSTKFFSGKLEGNPITSKPTDIAKFVVDSLPKIEPLIFDVLFLQDGTHFASGYVYANKTYGMINIQILGSSKISIVYLENGKYIQK